MYPLPPELGYVSCMEPNREEIRTWLHQVLRATGETPTAFAKRAGLAQTTLTRFLNDDDAPMFAMRTFSKIVEAAGEAGGPGPLGLAIAAPVGLAETPSTPYAAEPGTDMQRAIAALIGDRVAADPWRLGEPSGIEDAGYLSGDIVIVDLGEQARAGDLVCAQDYNWERRDAETVFRFYDPPYLTAASRLERFRRPLLLDGQRVIIKGVVIGSLRPRRR